jgi:RNA polymerase sigma-70 factor (ECF subfamily)
MRIVTVDAARAAGLGGSQGLTTANEGRIDPAVVAGLYLEHADGLRAFLIGVLRNGELAGEALQATFVKAMESGHTAREESLKGWLYRVAFHEAMAIRRRDRLEGKSVRQAGWKKPQGDDSPEEHLVRWETVDAVRAALELLPAEQRRVVSMRIYEEKTFAVIAKELAVPLGTVLSRMRMALRKLANHLESKQ